MKSEGSDTLHMHDIPKIAGLSRRILDYIRGCNNPETKEPLKEKFRTFVDRVVTCPLPVSFGEQEPLPCLNYGALNSIEPMKELPKSLTGHFRDMPKPPPTSQYSSCTASFGGVQMLLEKVKMLHETLKKEKSNGVRIPLSDTERIFYEITESLCCVFDRLQCPSAMSDWDP